MGRGTQGGDARVVDWVQIDRVEHPSEPGMVAVVERKLEAAKDQFAAFRGDAVEPIEEVETLPVPAGPDEQRHGSEGV